MAEEAKERGSIGREGTPAGFLAVNYSTASRRNVKGIATQGDCKRKKTLKLGIPPLSSLCNINISGDVVAALETRLSSAPKDEIQFLQGANGHRISATKPSNFTEETSINT